MATIKEFELHVRNAELNLKEAEVKLDFARGTLRDAILEQRPRTAEDYRLVIEQDPFATSWRSTEDMLADVLGDYTFEDAFGTEEQALAHFGGSKRKLKEAKERHAAYIQTWIDAYEDGAGIYVWFGALYERDPLTGEFEEGDTCSGFYSIGGYTKDVEEQVRDTLVPTEFKDIEVCSLADIKRLNGEA